MAQPAEVKNLGDPEEFFAEATSESLGTPEEFFGFLEEEKRGSVQEEAAAPAEERTPILIPGIDVVPLSEEEEEEVSEAEPEEGRLPTEELVGLIREEAEEEPEAVEGLGLTRKEKKLWREAGRGLIDIDDPEARGQALDTWKDAREAGLAQKKEIPLDLRQLALLLRHNRTSAEDLTEGEKEYLRSFKNEAKKYGFDVEELLGEKKERRWNRVWRGVKNAAKNWWWSISPQERNKILWGAGVAVGLAESHAATMLLPGVGGWLKGIVNAALINGANLALSRHYTREMHAIKEKIESEGEEEVKQELQAKYEAIEQRYSKTGKYIRDFAAGMAAGATVYSVGRIAWTVGEAAYNAYIRPTEVAPLVKEMPKFEGERLKLPAKPVKPPTPKAVEEVKKVFKPSVVKAVEVRLPVSKAVEVKVPSFFGEVKIDASKGAGNFWKAFEKMATGKIPGTNWINPENGVTRDDVINHAIIKLLRARGVNVDLVRDGKVFKLMELLKPEEKAVIEKIAATESVAGYLKEVRPGLLNLLNK